MHDHQNCFTRGDNENSPMTTAVVRFRHEYLSRFHPNDKKLAALLCIVYFESHELPGLLLPGGVDNSNSQKVEQNLEDKFTEAADTDTANADQQVADVPSGELCTMKVLVATLASTTCDGKVSDIRRDTYWEVV